jgi:hypothetical protein
MTHVSVSHADGLHERFHEIHHEGIALADDTYEQHIVVANDHCLEMVNQVVDIFNGDFVLGCKNAISLLQQDLFCTDSFTISDGAPCS